MVADTMKLALCTTIYPGVERYLPAWYESVRAQTDDQYELWIALDELDSADVFRVLGEEFEAVWVQAEHGETPAAIRQRVLEPIVDQFDGVILVDSDDLLHPERVARARAGLTDHDLVACALRLVGPDGADLGFTFTLPDASGPDGSAPDRILPRHNVFGFSNTAWRCELLRRCLPVPAEVEIVDWFVATRAWLLGARLGFDRTVGMDYRRHAANLVNVRAPFDLQKLRQDTERARRHFRLVGAALPPGASSARAAELAAVAADVERFAEQVLGDPELLDRYLIALNELDPAPLWWSSVAHPALAHLWSESSPRMP